MFLTDMPQILHVNTEHNCLKACCEHSCDVLHNLETKEACRQLVGYSENESYIKNKKRRIGAFMMTLDSSL